MDDDGAASSRSPSLSPSRSSSPLPLADPVTVAAVPPGHLALAIPIQKTGPSSGGGTGGGREDAWSDGATSTLIDAWGDRFVALGRGSLRHPQWQEVAEVVSSRDGYSKPPKSDVQCKNRIDTLKKKYKVEKAKSDSSWPYFDRLDYLLAPVHKPGGNSATAAGNSSSSNPAARSTAPLAPRVNFPQRTRTSHLPSSSMKRKLPSPPQLSASSESSDGFPPEPPIEAANGKRQRVEESVNGADSSDRVQGLRDLAQAIRRFGEAYERVESSKRDQELRLERDRLDAARELEDQRVQFFLKMQMEISKTNNGASLGIPFVAAAMVSNSATTAAAAAAAAAADGNGSQRMSTGNDVATSSNHHVRYHGKDGRHQPHHRPSHHPPYKYNQNNVNEAAAGTGSGSESDNKEDEEMEEEEDEEEESQ